jgi:hypothetical protein
MVSPAIWITMEEPCQFQIALKTILLPILIYGDIRKYKENVYVLLRF